MTFVYFLIYLDSINNPEKYSKIAYSLDRIFKGFSVDTLKKKEIVLDKISKKELEDKLKIRFNNMGKLNQL